MLDRTSASQPVLHDQGAFPEMPDVETSSAEYAHRFAGKVGEYFLSVQTRMTLDLLKEWPNATVLDVGGGHAQIAVPLVHRGFDVTVVGSSEECRKRLDLQLDSHSFQFRCGNILSLPFEDKSFDVVLAFRLLPHVNLWRVLLAEMCRVARKVVLVDYPDIVSFNFVSKYLFTAKKAIEGNTRPFTCFSCNELLQELAKHGFGNASHCREFFVPMVVHRAVGKVWISKAVESVSRLLGLTHAFGSPVVLRVVREIEPSVSAGKPR